MQHRRSTPCPRRPSPRHWLACLALSLFSGAMAASIDLPPDLRHARWTDSAGKSLQFASMRAPWVVMTMAYTACRRTCSTSTLVLSDIQRQLDLMNQRAEFVVVSFDPANDSPQAWDDYRRKRGLMRDNWHFLSGGARDTRLLARLLDVDYWSYHGHVVHDFRIVVFDAEWRVAFQLDWDQVDRLPQMIEAAVRRDPPR